MSHATLFAADLVAIAIVVFALYFPRHHRRDLVVAFLGVNIGVMAVANALSSTAATAGLGLGLFGVLSIIRLRSTELDQQEVAYYFASLALGLLGGLESNPIWLAPTLMAVIVVVLLVGDHPALFQNYRRQVLTLDVAFTNESALVSHLEQLLGATVLSVDVRKIDLVQHTTALEVRYRLPASAASVGQSDSGSNNASRDLPGHELAGHQA